MAPRSTSFRPLKATLTGEQIQKLSPELQKKLASGQKGEFTRADAQALYNVMGLSKEDLHSALQSRDVDIWDNSDAKDAIEYLFEGKDAEDVCDEMGYDCWYDLEKQTSTIFEDLEANKNKIHDQHKEALMARLKRPAEKRETGVSQDDAYPQPTLHDGKVYSSKLGELKFRPNNGDEQTLYDTEDLEGFLDLEGTQSKHLPITALHAIYSERAVKAFEELAKAQPANKALPAAKASKAPLLQRDATTTQPQLDTVNPGDLPQPMMWGIVGGVGVVLVLMLAAFTGFKAGRRNRRARKEQVKESA